MKNKFLPFLLIVFVLCAGIFAIFLIHQFSGETEKTIIPTPSPEISNISVSSPRAGQEVKLPFDILGQARVFENMLSVRLVEQGTGKLLFQSSVYANAPDIGQFGPFQKTIDYLISKPTGGGVVLEAYDNSAKDGSEIDLISVPLRLNLADTSVVKVFYNNSNLDPEISCNKVFAAERVIAKTLSPARKALELLLEEPSQNEKNNGFSTSINPGVTIQGLTITGGLAKVDFDEKLEEGIGGSCRVSAIRAQITETLKQFSTVKSVIISINGRTEDILQP